MTARTATVCRTTRETHIEVSLNLDGTGQTRIQTPLPFLSHMLEQLGRHGLFDLAVHATGDTHIDGHHTTEDLGIVLGQAVDKALGAKEGIVRYGHATLPMDEALVVCAVDLSGRAFFVEKLRLPKTKVGEFDTELCPVFFDAFARGASANLHLHKLAGTNLHHIIEISFKAFAKALLMATRVDARIVGVPSTKGVL